MKGMKFALACGALSLVAVALTACGSEGGSGSPDGSGPAATSELSAPAGDAARALGISSWKLGSEGKILGIGEKGQVVVQFLAHKDRREIESLAPQGGSKILEEGGADTLSIDSRKFYDAMIVDVKALAAPAAATKDLGNGVKSNTQPIWYGPYACCYGNRAGQYYHWVNSNGTGSPYCHVDVFSYSCSGLTTCFAYGNATGCLYWI